VSIGTGFVKHSEKPSALEEAFAVIRSVGATGSALFESQAKGAEKVVKESQDTYMTFKELETMSGGAKEIFVKKSLVEDYVRVNFELENDKSAMDNPSLSSYFFEVGKDAARLAISEVLRILCPAALKGLTVARI